jgi:phage minor structural protein
LIKILNQNREPVAILENAYDIGYEKEYNSLWKCSFSLPLNDQKNEHCKPFNYVELYDNATLAEDGNIERDYIGLFRIMPKLTTKNDSGNYVTYECEHVLGMLLNTFLFQDHQLTNLTTTEALSYLLNKQKVKHWKLGRVQFVRRFSYLWENENLLSAIYSVPNPFDVQFEWNWNTQSYPWTLELLVPATEATAQIKEGKNLRGLDIEDNPMDVYNRIYPLGVGEGVNQLTIKDVNGGIPYIEDAASVADNGPIEYIWPDRRYQDAATLKAAAEAMLKKWKEPIVTWSVSAADLSSITGESIDKFRVGKIVRLNVDGFPSTDLRIMKESKPDITGRPGEINLEVGNVVEDLGTSYGDIRERQRINELYAQGATNLLSYSYNDNADQNNPAEIVFFLPDEMQKLNKLTLWFETTNFRAYEKAIGGGGATLTTTKSGGATTISKTVTSKSGGASTLTSEFAAPTFFLYSSTLLPLTGATLENHFHAVEVTNELNHRHGVKTLPHEHDVVVEVAIPDHVHPVELEDHEHDLQFGIFKLPDIPTDVTIKVDGNPVSFSGTSGEDIDLIPYLDKDSDGKVTRGKHVVSLTPNERGRINAQINTQFFIQSRGGYTL